MKPSTKLLIKGLVFTTIGGLLLLNKMGFPLWQRFISPHFMTLLYLGIIAYGLVLISKALK